MKSRPGCDCLPECPNCSPSPRSPAGAGWPPPLSVSYEEKNLIDSERAGSGHRRYRRPVLRRIAFIVFAQKIGLTLEEIGQELSKLPEDRAPTGRDWSLLSSKWSSRIDERIEEIERQVRPDRMHGCGCLSLSKCKLANPGDRVAGQGPGPRSWVSA